MVIDIMAAYSRLYIADNNCGWGALNSLGINACGAFLTI